MQWTILFSNKAGKQVKRLNKKVLTILRLLVEDLKFQGPDLKGAWPHYGKLRRMKKDYRHCHLMRGNPTYVCCWEVVDKKQRVIEVYYVGSHEKAPY